VPASQPRQRDEGERSGEVIGPAGVQDDSRCVALREGAKPSSLGAFKAESLGWLIERYRESTAWTNLSQATRHRRERILLAITATARKTASSRIDRSAIERGIERRNQYGARPFLQTMRGLFEWATKAKLVDADPTMELKVTLPFTDGHHVWTDDECAAYDARWPHGTRERVAFDVLLYTGLRRGDAVRLGRPHVKNGAATIRTEKTAPQLVPSQYE